MRNCIKFLECIKSVLECIKFPPECIKLTFSLNVFGMVTLVVDAAARAVVNPAAARRACSPGEDRWEEVVEVGWSELMSTPESWCSKEPSFPVLEARILLISEMAPEDGGT